MCFFALGTIPHEFFSSFDNYSLFIDLPFDKKNLDLGLVVSSDEFYYHNVAYYGGYNSAVIVNADIPIPELSQYTGFRLFSNIDEAFKFAVTLKSLTKDFFSFDVVDVLQLYEIRDNGYVYAGYRRSFWLGYVSRP